jgi:hypothetical protein
VEKSIFRDGGRNVDMSEGITHHLAWISCRARDEDGADGERDYGGVGYGVRTRTSRSRRDEGDHEFDGAASAARPSDFDDSQTARVSGAPDPLLRTSTALRLCQKQTTNMLNAEDKFKARTL